MQPAEGGGGGGGGGGEGAGGGGALWICRDGGRNIEVKRDEKTR